MLFVRIDPVVNHMGGWSTSFVGKASHSSITLALWPSSLSILPIYNNLIASLSSPFPDVSPTSPDVLLSTHALESRLPMLASIEAKGSLLVLVSRVPGPIKIA
jgi:hypothetical protein